uniref:Tc1-like transposase DDE domain-containing protein n=1 Tax=Oncorhynchus tshawytscha TaxID=74940 RepID=A0AAZ3S4W1_ONCTS
MFQHDYALPHVARICTQFLEAENVPVLPWPAYSPDMSTIELIWDALDRCVRQRVPVPTNIQQLHTAIEEEWDNIPHATINSLINSMRRRYVAWQIVVTSDTDWYSDSHPYLFFQVL